MVDYFKIGKASELTGTDKKIYRALEILPGTLSWMTLFGLIILSYFYPVQVAFFIIAFDVYWLLLVIFLGVHLFAAYKKLQENKNIDWLEKCKNLNQEDITPEKISNWDEVIQLIILPTYKEDYNLIKPTFEALVNDNFPSDRMIVVFAVEDREGEAADIKAEQVRQDYEGKFRNLYITKHIDQEGELKGKCAIQAWAAQHVKEDIIDKENIDYDKIIISVLDVDTIIATGYFCCVTYHFLTTEKPYRSSYQPVPVYFNNIWEAPFFARVAANSNTFWQMMQQIRVEKLATYSSHSMTWRALVDIGFWSTTMVSEDSRIFWHCFCHYRGDYEVIPLHFPVSMDVTMDESALRTIHSLYIQQRRWGWGVENIPYLIFNTMKLWKEIPKGRFMNRIFVQLYGFHSWATNALIIGVIGWLPMILGGDKFNSTVLSANLPFVTRTLMMLAMSGLLFSAIISTLLLPKKPEKYGFFKYISMFLQWLILPISIIFFGALPGLAAQTRLMFDKPLGFKVTVKKR